MPASKLVGRATGVRDRAQRAAVAYDDRGNAVWTARQVAVISAAAAIDITALGAGERPTFPEPSIAPSSVIYDSAEGHTYIRTAHFDHAGRPRSMTLPQDPDYEGAPPLVQGTLEYDQRGLPASADLIIDGEHTAVVSAIHYLRDGLVDSIAYGEHEDAPIVSATTSYDDRRRPTHLRSTRVPTATSGMQAIDTIADQRLVWDAASNLTAILDQRDPSQWPIGHRPQSVEIQHDSLYRVVGALFNYTAPGDGVPRAPFETIGTDEARDWRDDATTSNAVDPMRPVPAPIVTDDAPQRVQALTWDWDWLGNMTEWTDDAQQFYERSIGEIANGHDVDERPSALYLASNLSSVSGDGGGYVELDYGVGGNVTALTVHGQCIARSSCTDPGGRDIDARRTALASCECALVQHYQYRWDELNRINEARRFNQASGGVWSLEARQRYRYDGANVRVVKESFATGVSSNADSRIALYVYPGDFEPRGVVRDQMGQRYAGHAETGGTGEVIQTETQYLVAGARMVWQHQDHEAIWAAEEDRNHRVTIPVSDLLHTTSASVDLRSGELLEASTYYPNGARESLLTEGSYGEGGSTGALAPLEPMGFTGKEADEDVGLVYFGERYLIARLGRWASPDPLATHGASGGEVLNAFHYLSGNLLAGRDPVGLQDAASGARALATPYTPQSAASAPPRDYASALASPYGGPASGPSAIVAALPDRAGLVIPQNVIDAWTVASEHGDIVSDFVRQQHDLLGISVTATPYGGPGGGVILHGSLDTERYASIQNEMDQRSGSEEFGADIEAFRALEEGVALWLSVLKEPTHGQSPRTLVQTIDTGGSPLAVGDRSLDRILIHPAAGAWHLYEGDQRVSGRDSYAQGIVMMLTHELIHPADMNRWGILTSGYHQPAPEMPQDLAYYVMRDYQPPLQFGYHLELYAAKETARLERALGLPVRVGYAPARWGDYSARFAPVVHFE